jgi:hypothetical protein
VLTALLLATAAPAPSWPAAPYVEVRAYAYNLRGDSAPPIMNGAGVLHRSVVNRKGARLSANQVLRLLAAITGEHPDHPRAACFYPRHAFVYYDAETKPVAWLEVCFECLGGESHPDGLRGPFDMPALAELTAELRLARSPGRAFRANFDAFRRRLRAARGPQKP